MIFLKHYVFKVPEVPKPVPEEKVPVPKKVPAPPTKGTYIYVYMIPNTIQHIID